MHNSFLKLKIAQHRNSRQANTLKQPIKPGARYEVPEDQLQTSQPVFKAEYFRAGSKSRTKRKSKRRQQPNNNSSTCEGAQSTNFSHPQGLSYDRPFIPESAGPSTDLAPYRVHPDRQNMNQSMALGHNPQNLTGADSLQKCPTSGTYVNEMAGQSRFIQQASYDEDPSHTAASTEHAQFNFQRKKSEQQIMDTEIQTPPDNIPEEPVTADSDLLAKVEPLSAQISNSGHPKGKGRRLSLSAAVKKRKTKQSSNTVYSARRQNPLVTACNTYSVNMAHELDSHNMTLYANFRNQQGGRSSTEKYGAFQTMQHYLNKVQSLKKKAGHRPGSSTSQHQDKRGSFWHCQSDPRYNSLVDPTTGHLSNACIGVPEKHSYSTNLRSRDMVPGFVDGMFPYHVQPPKDLLFGTTSSIENQIISPSNIDRLAMTQGYDKFYQIPHNISGTPQTKLQPQLAGAPYLAADTQQQNSPPKFILSLLGKKPTRTQKQLQQALFLKQNFSKCKHKEKASKEQSQPPKKKLQRPQSTQANRKSTEFATPTNTATINRLAQPKQASSLLNYSPTNAGRAGNTQRVQSAVERLSQPQRRPSALKARPKSSQERGRLAKSMVFTVGNPLNNSSSKQMFSFSKSDRKSAQSRRQYCDKFYDLGSTCAMTNIDKKRTPGFGIGKKTSMADIRKDVQRQPGPSHYNLKSKFEVNRLHQKGFTFGESNEAYKKVYREDLSDLKGWTEPGLYNIDTFAELIKKSKKGVRMMKPTSKSPKKVEVSPGPGAYDDKQSLNKLGRYANAKHSNSGSQNFGKELRNSFKVSSTTPGPGTYQDVLALARENCPKSNFQSQRSTAFGKYSERFPEPLKTSKNHPGDSPGPGKYEIISDFGVYDPGQLSSNKMNPYKYKSAKQFSLQYTANHSPLKSKQSPPLLPLDEPITEAEMKSTALLKEARQLNKMAKASAGQKTRASKLGAKNQMQLSSKAYAAALTSAQNTQQTTVDGSDAIPQTLIKSYSALDKVPPMEQGVRSLTSKASAINSHL